MKKAFLFIVFLFAAANTYSQSSNYVQGYTNSYRTYVQYKFKTPPPSKNLDRHNTNPYPDSKYIIPVQYYHSKTISSGFTSSSSNTNPTHKSPSWYSYPTSNDIITGSKGGAYYINSNENKMYLN
jgi:hypothetical protein